MIAFFAHFFWLIFVTTTMTFIYHRYGVRRGDFAEVFGTLYPPLILVVLYGYIPLQVYIYPNSKYSTDPVFYFLSFFVISMGAASYLLGFHFHRLTRSVRRSLSPNKSFNDLDFSVLFLLIAALDFYARITMMLEGTYFSWMAAAKRHLEHVDPGVMHMLSEGTGPLLGAVAIYFLDGSKRYKLYLLMLAFLVFLEGSRGSLTYFLFSIGVAWIHKNGVRSISYARFLVCALLLFLGYGLIIDMRVTFIQSADQALEDPVPFIFEAAGSSIQRALGWGEESNVTDIQGAGFYERSLSWADVFSYQVDKIYSGKEPVGVVAAANELTSVIPSFLWAFGDKQKLNTGWILADHFETAHFTSGDPASTSFSSAYLFGGGIGLIIFGFLFGLIQRLMLYTCKTWFGEFGRYLYIGSITFVVIRANSFSGAFAGVRNFLMILIFSFLFLKVYREFSKNFR